MGLVVKSWAANNTPVDEQGNYVVIKARQEGLLSYILSLLGIDPITTMLAHPDRIEFVQASLSGINRRVIPLGSVSSLFYGYHKPLKGVLIFIAIVLFFSSSLLAARGGALFTTMIVLLDLVAIGGAVAYYFLNKRLTLGIVEVAGLGYGAVIHFKRALIEGQNIDEPEARKVCEIVQNLVEARLLGKQGSPSFQVAVSAQGTQGIQGIQANP